MTWVMRGAWGCMDLYDLGCVCGLGTFDKLNERNRYHLLKTAAYS
jgi:hypothetical protein